ncbi:Putative non-LTR retroelement reverse transcripta se [Trichuris trichiura]|uniref:Putative non-LTR retroelement reverse transcripta se n=1 Tax=Trichuris trichiura TaxID=36087 RepID=A0A077ZGS1_TRITR|nr:Putative non-LTR retroelement reverse transcripta se [Trichuris trichiura]
MDTQPSRPHRRRRARRCRNSSAKKKPRNENAEAKAVVAAPDYPQCSPGQGKSQPLSSRTKTSSSKVLGKRDIREEKIDSESLKRDSNSKRKKGRRKTATVGARLSDQQREIDSIPTGAKKSEKSKNIRRKQAAVCSITESEEKKGPTIESENDTRIRPVREATLSTNQRKKMRNVSTTKVKNEETIEQVGEAIPVGQSGNNEQQKFIRDKSAKEGIVSNEVEVICPNAALENPFQKKQIIKTDGEEQRARPLPSWQGRWQQTMQTGNSESHIGQSGSNAFINNGQRLEEQKFPSSETAATLLHDLRRNVRAANEQYFSSATRSNIQRFVPRQAKPHFVNISASADTGINIAVRPTH